MSPPCFKPGSGCSLPGSCLSSVMSPTLSSIYLHWSLAGAQTSQAVSCFGPSCSILCCLAFSLPWWTVTREQCVTSCRMSLTPPQCGDLSLLPLVCTRSTLHAPLLSLWFYFYACLPHVLCFVYCLAGRWLVGVALISLDGFRELMHTFVNLKTKLCNNVLYAFNFVFIHTSLFPREVASGKVRRVYTEMSYASMVGFSLLSFSVFPNCLKWTCILGSQKNKTKTVIRRTLK